MLRNKRKNGSRNQNQLERMLARDPFHAVFLSQVAVLINVFKRSCFVTKL